MADPNKDRKPDNTPPSPSSLLDSLWSLPSTIYQRGNEHGREFSRLFEERREREKEQEREDGRGSRACGWRGRRDHEWGQNQKQNEEQGKDEVGDWMGRVVRELERGEKEAKELYDSWWRQMEGGGEGKQEQKTSQIQRQAEEIRKQRGSEASWASIFPAWENRPAPAASMMGSDNDDAAKRQMQRMREQLPGMLDTMERNLPQWMDFVDREIKKMDPQEVQRMAEEAMRALGFMPPQPAPRSPNPLHSSAFRRYVPEESAISYLMYSEYSPLHLEHVTGFDATFRRRFEDLVRVQGGKQMRDGDKPESEMEWLGQIVPLLEEKEGEKKGGSVTISPDETTGRPYASVLKHAQGQCAPWRQSRNSLAQKQQSQAAQSPSTEEDAYKQYFQRETELAVKEQAAAAQRQPLPSPSILSTLSTTERVFNPDGTVTTKTTLKKHFADGREESTEKMFHRPRAAAPIGALIFEQQREMLQKNAEESKRGSGWFWSS